MEEGCGGWLRRELLSCVGLCAELLRSLASQCLWAFPSERRGWRLAELSLRTAALPLLAVGLSGLRRRRPGLLLVGCAAASVSHVHLVYGALHLGVLWAAGALPGEPWPLLLGHLLAVGLSFLWSCCLWAHWLDLRRRHRAREDLADKFRLQGPRGDGHSLRRSLPRGRNADTVIVPPHSLHLPTDAEPSTS